MRVRSEKAAAFGPAPGRPAAFGGPPHEAIRPREEVTLVVGPSVPGWALRGVLGVAALGTLALTGASVPEPFVLVAVVIVGLLVARPADGWAGLVVLAVGVAVLAANPMAASRLAGLVLGVHVLVRLAAVAGRAGGRDAVELAVLGTGWRRWVVAQALGQVATLATVALRGVDAPGAGRLIALVAALAVVVLALPRTRPEREESQPRR